MICVEALYDGAEEKECIIYHEREEKSNTTKPTRIQLCSAPELPLRKMYTKRSNEAT
jgi:hypothetical protein